MINIQQYRHCIGLFNTKVSNKVRSVKCNSKSNNNIFVLVYFIMILSAQINSNYTKYKAFNLNRDQYIYYGNIRTNFKIIHWNKGNSNFSNKINEIYTILDQSKPDIFSLVEANYPFSDPIKIKDYAIEFSRMIISRVHFLEI